MADEQSTVEYRDIPGFPGYRVGSDGSLWTSWVMTGKTLWKIVPGRWRRRILKPNRNGQLRPVLRRDKKDVSITLHRIILEIFVGPCPLGMECCHHDGNMLNNAVGNLRWDTHYANMQDQLRHGRTTRGERNPKAKLTEDAVREIRREIADRKAIRTIARERGVSRTAIYDIARGLKWKHVPI